MFEVCARLLDEPLTPAPAPGYAAVEGSAGAGAIAASSITTGGFVFSAAAVRLPARLVNI